MVLREEGSSQIKLNIEEASIDGFLPASLGILSHHAYSTAQGQLAGIHFLPLCQCRWIHGELIHKTWDCSKGFSSETNKNNELVLDIDVKKKVKTRSSILYAQFRHCKL
jgi:hypothetical protein